MRSFLQRSRSRITYANVTATIALMIALGGTSYAVSKLPAKSVGARQLKSNAVSSPKVKDGSLLGQDFKPGQIPAGEPGAPGVTGPRGPSDAFQTSTSNPLTLGNAFSPTTLASLSLPAGSYVVTGQATVDNGSNVLSGTAICYLLRAGGNTFFGVVREGLDTNQTEDDRAAATPIGAVTLPAPETIRLACSYDAGVGSSTMAASDRRLIAIQVASLH